MTLNTQIIKNLFCYIKNTKKKQNKSNYKLFIKSDIHFID